MFFRQLRIFFLISALLLIAGSVFLLFFREPAYAPTMSSVGAGDFLPLDDILSEKATPRVTIGDAMVLIEVVDTPASMSRGLSERESLDENAGMLFVYEEAGLYHFWMLNMNFSIDIIWVGKDNTILDITHDLSPDTYPETFTSLGPAQYVLEVNAGWVQRNNVAIGMEVMFHFKN